MNSSQLQALPARPNALASGGSGAQLVLEPLVDTGNAVPIGIALQAPTGLSFQTLRVFAPNNPVSEVLRIELPERMSHFAMQTRIRLGASQTVWLTAELPDGSWLIDSQSTVITSSACFDAS